MGSDTARNMPAMSENMLLGVSELVAETASYEGEGGEHVLGVLYMVLETGDARVIATLHRVWRECATVRAKLRRAAMAHMAGCMVERDVDRGEEKLRRSIEKVCAPLFEVQLPKWCTENRYLALSGGYESVQLLGDIRRLLEQAHRAHVRHVYAVLYGEGGGRHDGTVVVGGDW